MKSIKTIDEQGVMYSLSGEDLPENYVLSLKNCEAIELDYDLDELACSNATIDIDSYKDIKHYKDNTNCNITELSSEWDFLGAIKYSEVEAFKKGVATILEILGDKKFSEEDMKSFARNYYREIRENTSNLLWTQLADKCIEEHIQSLQQTEWDVEIEMEDKLLGLSLINPIPKLDADGCLILKRK